MFHILAKPAVVQEDLIATIEGSFATLVWTELFEDAESITVIIEQCEISGTCMHHNVSTNPGSPFRVSLLNGEHFYLIVYQDGLEAYRSDQFDIIYATTQSAGQIISRQ